MTRQTTRILIAALWLASLAGVYFLGQSASSAGDGDAGPPITMAIQRADVSLGRRVGQSLPAGSDSDDSTVGSREAKSIASLVAQARVAIGNGESSLRAFAPFLGLDAAQLQEALAEVEGSVKDPGQRNMLYSVLLAEWARTDGAAAMTFAAERIKPKSASIQGNILGAWARTAPDAAWRWYDADRQKDPADPNTHRNAQAMAQSLFTGMAASDLDSALGRLTGLDIQVRSLAIIGISNAAGDQFARTRLLDRAAALTPELRKQIHETVVRSWAMFDPEAAVGWLRTRSTEEQAEIRPALEKTIMMQDPRRGAELLLEVTPESERPSAYHAIFENWAPRDPPAAMDWSKTVADAEQRAMTVRKIYVLWRSRDTASAEVALAASGLPAEQIAEIKKAPLVPKR
jgi:hypothetical protein